MSDLKYSYNEFLALVLIYVSFVDMEFTESEKELIGKKVGEKTFSHVMKDFNELSDFQAFQTILSYKGVYFPTSEQKEEILADIKALFLSDHDFSILEKETFHFLEKLM